MNKVLLSNRGKASSVTLSSITINSFTYSLVHSFTCPLNMFLCYFVFPYPVFLSNLFTCPLKMFLCYFVFYYNQLVHSFTCPLVHLSTKYVPLLLCLPLPCLLKQAVHLSNKKSAKTFEILALCD